MKNNPDPRNEESLRALTAYPLIKIPTDPESGSSIGVDTTPQSEGLCCAEAGNPAYKRGRRFQLCQMILLPFIPILALIVQTSLTLHHLLQYRNDMESVENQVGLATDFGKLVTQMQMERSEVAFYIFTNGSTEPLRSGIDVQFNKTDMALDNTDTWAPIHINGTVINSKEEFRYHLAEFRKQVSADDSTIKDVLVWYTSVNAAMLDHLTTQIKETDNSGVWRYLLAFKNILRSIENMGIALTYGISYYGQGRLTPDNYIRYIRHETLSTDLLAASFNYVPNIKKMYESMLSNFSDFKHIKIRNEEILRHQKRVASISDAIAYTDSMTLYVDELRKIQVFLRRLITKYVEKDLIDAANKEAIGIVILVTVLVISPIIIVLVRNAVATIQMYAASLADKARELTREKKKSDDLLYQMLPPSVAMQLKQTQQVPAEYYEAVTVYFCDIVGFTEMAAISTPIEVVTFLNSIYRVFDWRIECYDVYKVESSGDSYMVASGLPVKNGNKHVTEIATMALDLLAAASDFKIPHRRSTALEIRSGVHTGPVVAGIIGTKMPRYCLYGDTVNTASRMESTGEAQKIHISLEMKQALDLAGGFVVEHRGLVDVKGKGLMDTYWLTCKKGGIQRPRPTQHFSQQGPSFLQRVKNAHYD